jgi:putative oxidoreductase
MTNFFDKIQDQLALAGRLLLAWLFLPAGLAKVGGFAGTVGYIQSVGLPLPALAAIAAIVIEIVGGAALIAGYGSRLAAAVLAVFTLAATLSFHAYWAAPADQQFMQQLLFDKNIAVIGGLLVLAAFGPGRFALGKAR